MIISRNRAVARMKIKDADGNFLSAITGSESDAELRELITNLACHCFECGSRAHCPFQMLNKLTYESRKQLVDTMQRPTMLMLFETELECRTRYASGSEF